MNKKLINNLKEFREWAWDISLNGMDVDICEAIGIIPITECHDNIRLEDGTLVDVDENGDIIPPDSQDNVKLSDKILQLEFPILAVYHISEEDYLGFIIKSCLCEYITLSDFYSTKFSELPELSWEKIMIKVVERIGGDGAGLVQWSDTIPKPYETAKEILRMFEYVDPDLTEGSLSNFL